MDGKRKTLSMVWLVIEALFLAFVLYLLADSLVLAMRMGRGLNLRFVITSLALVVPGAFLIKGYRSFASGKDDGSAILACAGASAVVFGLSVIPGIKLFLFGLDDIPGMQTMNIRLMELMFGLHSTKRIFLFSLIMQTVFPIVLLLLTRQTNLLKNWKPRNYGFALVNVAVSILAVWADYAITRALIRADTFGHSWLIVGFVPIPGQIMLLLPSIVAFAVIVVIWSRPWHH